MSERRSTESKQQIFSDSNDTESNSNSTSNSNTTQESDFSDNQNKNDNKLVAYLELDDRSISEVSKLCKEQMTQDVADKVVEILACNVVKCDKLKEEFERTKKKLEVANRCAHDAKRHEIKAINSMRTWRARAIYMFLACLVVFAVFMVAGDDVTRYFGQPGCLSFSESKYLYSKLIRYYLIYIRYLIADLCEWIMRATNQIIHFCQNSVTM